MVNKDKSKYCLRWIFTQLCIIIKELWKKTTLLDDYLKQVQKAILKC